MATYERIAQRAYERFLERGGEHGHDREDWSAAERDLATYEVVFLAPGTEIIEVMRELRELTGLGLREIKDEIDRGPFLIRSRASLEEAESIRSRIQPTGAQIAVRKVE